MLSMIAAAAGIAMNQQAQPANPYANETKAQRDERMGWWREARFGMFIHWGVYSVPAGTYKDRQVGGIGEWIMLRGKIPVAEYKAYASEFNPVNYDPDAWVRMAKDAGMKYIVITSKHHDGFALFDSKVTDWDIVDATPYGKDLLKPLAEACRKHGMKLGFYYSQAQDWNHPGGAKAGAGGWDPAQDGDMMEYVKSIAVPQVKEILTNYGDIAVLWWDTPVGMTKEMADELFPQIRLQPGIIVNNRLGTYKGDTDTPEQHIPATGIKGRDWETCMTMNDTWGFKSYDTNWKSTKTLVHNLIDIASKGGNYLLNIGPTRLGEFPEASVERLGEIGDWMDRNGESIYGTSASPFKKLEWGRVTTKKLDSGVTRLYLHVFDWPENGEILLPGLSNTPLQARSLAVPNRRHEIRSSEEGVVIFLSSLQDSEISSTIIVEIEGDPVVEPTYVKQQPGGIIVLEPADAEMNGSSVTVEEKNGRDNIGFWTNEDDSVEWSVNVFRAGEFSVMAEAGGPADTFANLKWSGMNHECKFKSTGDYGVFREQDLGRIAISGPGKITFSLVPAKGRWKPVNIRRLTLVPSGG
jgi:alpha-L-fucosidase